MYLTYVPKNETPPFRHRRCDYLSGIYGLAVGDLERE